MTAQTASYYSIHKYENLPLHILQAESTLCIKYNFGESVYVRVTPLTKDYFLAGKNRFVALINPSQEDLTYLTLLGVKYKLAAQSRIIELYDTIVETGIYRVTI